MEKSDGGVDMKIIIPIIIFFLLIPVIVKADTTFFDDPDDFFIMGNMTLGTDTGSGGAGPSSQANITPKANVIYACMNDDECKIIYNTANAFCRNNTCTTEAPIISTEATKQFEIPFLLSAAVFLIIIYAWKSHKDEEEEGILR